MTPQRLEQIEEVYHSARDRALAERGAFLAEACGGEEVTLRASNSAGCCIKSPTRKVRILARAGFSPPVNAGSLLSTVIIVLPKGWARRTDGRPLGGSHKKIDHNVASR
jgi:hypothetical protein